MVVKTAGSALDEPLIDRTVRQSVRVQHIWNWFADQTIGQKDEATFLWGLVTVTRFKEPDRRSWYKDGRWKVFERDSNGYWKYLCVNHPVLSCFYFPANHPYTRGLRVFTMVNTAIIPLVFAALMVFPAGFVFVAYPQYTWLPEFFSLLFTHLFVNK